MINSEFFFTTDWPERQLVNFDDRSVFLPHIFSINNQNNTYTLPSLIMQIGYWNNKNVNAFPDQKKKQKNINNLPCIFDVIIGI